MKFEWGVLKADISLIEFVGAMLLLFSPSPLKLISRNKNQKGENNMDLEVKALDPELKKVLLELGEDGAKVLLHKLFMPELKKFVEKTENKWDDLVVPFLPQIEAALDSALDKIDGEVG